MFQQISDLGDEKLGRNAALSLIQHVSKSNDAGYVLKRLVGGLSSTKLATKSGCYTTLCALLGLQRVTVNDIHDVIKATLVTSKESSKKERRLTYIARILSYGSVLRSVPPDTVMKCDDFVSDCFSSLIDLCSKKHCYVTLAVPFLSFFLPLLTPEQFEQVRQHVVKLFENDDMLGASSRIMVAFSVAKFGQLPVLDDTKMLAKALVASRIEYEEAYVSAVFSHIKSSESKVTEFWSTLMGAIKSTQFETLCVCVESAVAADIPVSWFLSKPVVKMLISVFSRKDFEGNPRGVVGSVCDPNRIAALPGDERKRVLDVLFGEFPNVLAEYKYVSNVVRVLVQSLGEDDLEYLHGLLEAKLESSGARTIVTVLQLMGKVAAAQHCSDQLAAEILLKLVNLGTGEEQIEYKVNEGGQAIGGLITSCCAEVVVSALSSGVGVGVLEAVGKRVVHDRVKAVRKACKKSHSEQFKVVAWSLVVRDALGSQGELVDKLLEAGDSDAELIRFLLNDVLGLVNPGVNAEGLFNRMIMENRVGSDVINVIAEFMDVGRDGEGESDDESGDDDEEEEMQVKKMRLDDVAALKERFQAKSQDSDEESIELDDASEQDLKSMDAALANVFRIKRTVKDGQGAVARSLTRACKLVNLYVNRNVRCMDVGSVVMLLPPVVHSIVRLMKEPNMTVVVTTLISTLDNVLRVKKFCGYGGVGEGVLCELANEVLGLSRVKSVVRELMELTVLFLTRVFVGNDEKSREQEKAFVSLYTLAVELARGKIRKRKVTRGFETCRFVRVAIETFKGSWGYGVKRIMKAVEKQL